MNRFGHQAWNHWRTWLPQRLAELDDPQAYFTALGREVERSIVARWQDMCDASPARADEGYLERAGRLNMLRLEAEGTTVRELVLITPEEPDTPDLHQNQAEADLAQWRESTVLALIDEEQHLRDLSDEDLRLLVDGMPDRVLELAGITDDDLRNRGLR